MNDELLRKLMESVDPARDVSDETLRELFPHDALMAKIASGIGRAPFELDHVVPSSLWRRGPALVAASVLALAIAVAGALTVLNPSPASLRSIGAAAKTTTSLPSNSSVVPTTTRVSGSGVTMTGAGDVVPKCTPSQITEWMVSPNAPYVSTRDLIVKVIYENTGRVCTLTRTYVGVQAVAGINRVDVGRGSVTPADSLVGNIALQRGQTAAASIVIGSITSPSFRQMLKTHNGKCSPQLADAVKVQGLYGGWLTRYFALPERVPVCTNNFANVAAGAIAKTKRAVVHG